MATQWISPTWRMPTDTESPSGTGNNQSKFENYSLDFSAALNWVSYGNSLDFNTSNYSCSFWTKDTGGVAGTQVLMEKGSNKALSLHMQSGGKLYWYGGSGTIPFIDEDLQDGNWHHIVCVADGTTSYMYLDGVLKSTGGNRITAANTDDYILGGRNGGSYGYAGLFIQHCIYDSALSASQVTALYNSGTPVNPMALTPIPIAYYPLGGGSTGDAAVSSPSTLTVPNESVPGSTAFQTLGSGQLMDLGGSGLWSDILVGTNRTAIATLSYWIKGPFPSYHRQWEMGAANHDLRRVGTSQRFYYRAGAANTYQYYDMKDTGGTDIPGVDLDSSNWVHVVLVFPAGSVIDSSGTAASGGITDVNLFINGVECQKSSTSASGGYPTAWGSGGYGIQNYNNEQLTPRSNVQIWNSVLTSGEITTLYNNGTPYLGTQPQASNLKGWWRMNVHTSTWDGTNWIIGDSTANYTTALNFPGGTDYIDFGAGFPTTLGASATAATASGWVKISDLAQQQCLFNITTALGNYFGDFSIWYHSSSNQLQGYISGNSNNIKLNSGITDNKWHHLALVYDQSAGATITDGLKLYLDGSLITPTSSAGSTPASVDFTSISLSTRLGWGWSNTYTAVAEMSNWAMWNSALTAGNITTLYNDGTPETTISLSPTSYYKLDNTTTGIQDSGSASNNGTITGSVTEVDSFVSTLNGTSSGMTTANLVTSDLSRSIPYSSYSMYMTGSTDDTYFDLGTDIVVGTSGNTTYSWSIWVKPVHDGITDVVVFGDSGATDDGSLVLSHSGSTWTAKLEQTGTDLESSTGAIADNAWSHIAIVVDSTASTKKMYINGQEDTAAGGTGAGPDGTVKNINSSNTSNQYTGYVSNWAFWTSALSNDNILSIYNGGVPNSLTSLSPTHWWSMSGDSYYNGSAWTCPDLIGSNNLTGVNDSGQELIGDGPGSTANGVATSMDIPGNLEGNAPNSTNNAFSINMTEIDRVSGAGNVPG